VQNGIGTTVNMSSSGVAFRTGKTIGLQDFIKLSISGSFLDNAPTAFIAYGGVVRTSEELAAIHVLRRRFIRGGAGSSQIGDQQPKLSEEACTAIRAC
jgi:hypothetical protein